MHAIRGVDLDEMPDWVKLRNRGRFENLMALSQLLFSQSSRPSDFDT
jgi:hypothetical protein